MRGPFKSYWPSTGFPPEQWQDFSLELAKTSGVTLREQAEWEQREGTRHSLDLPGEKRAGPSAEALGIWTELSADGLSIELKFAPVPLDSPPDFRPGFTTSVTAWNNTTLFGPFRDPSAPSGSKPQGLALTVLMTSPGH